MSQKIEAFWHGKSIVITGASSGLGWALTEALAPFAVKFCLLSRREEKMRQHAEALKDSGSTFYIRSCDVRQRQQVYDAVQAFHAQTGRIDVVWVNSGISMDSSFENWQWEAFESMIDTNIKGAIYTAHACLEVMTKQGEGTLVGIGSAASMRGLPRRGVYSLTKVALDYYLQSVAVELPQIHVVTIHPGFVDTPINASNPRRFWLLTPEAAAQIMLKAVARHKRLLIYPFRMNLLFRFVRSLPMAVFEPLARRLMDFSRPPAAGKGAEHKIEGRRSRRL